jgi:hypothetical protein
MGKANPHENAAEMLYAAMKARAFLKNKPLIVFAGLAIKVHVS